MKILHTADFHISENSTIPVTKTVKSITQPVNIRTIDTFHRIRTMIDYAIESDVKYFIIAGDVFDAPVQPMFLKQLFAKHVKRLLKSKIYVLALVGNHDSDGMTNVFSDLRELTFDSKYLYIIDTPQQIKHKHIVFHCLPYQIPSKSISVIDQLTHFHEAKDYSKLNVLVGHFGVDGGVVGANEHTMRAEVTAEYLRGYNYVALGDYHTSQKLGNVRIKGTNEIWYSGSPIRLNMGEPEKKYFNVVKLVVGENGNPEVTNHYLPDRQYIKIRCNISALKQMVKAMLAGKTFRLRKQIIKQGSVIHIVSESTPEAIERINKKFKTLFIKIFKPAHLILEWKYIKIRKPKTKGMSILMNAYDAIKIYVKRYPPEHGLSSLKILEIAKGMTDDLE